jgi:hypothetical protein
MTPAPVDEEMNEEIEHQFFAELAAKLTRQDGAALTPAECEVLLTLIRNRPAPKRRRGRRVVDRTWMALASFWLEQHRGMTAGDAVSEIAKNYDVSKATVLAARQKLLAD